MLGPVPKLLLFTMVKNTDFLHSVNTNPYFFRHYDISDFAAKVNGKQIPTEGLAPKMGHETTSVMGYRILFEASGIHHSNSGLHITHDMYINGYFMLLYDLTPDRSDSGRTSHHDSGNMEFDNSVSIDYARKISTDFK